MNGSQSANTVRNTSASNHVAPKITPSLGSLNFLRPGAAAGAPPPAAPGRRAAVTGSAPVTSTCVVSVMVLTQRSHLTDAGIDHGVQQVDEEIDDHDEEHDHGDQA